MVLDLYTKDFYSETDICALAVVAKRDMMSAVADLRHYYSPRISNEAAVEELRRIVAVFDAGIHERFGYSSTTLIRLM